jgi:uncharacterized BrkB/YihY/UPF0761 family membrane protein
MKYIVVLVLTCLLIILATVGFILKYYWGPKGRPPRS